MQPAFLLPAILVSFIVYRWFKRGTSQSLPLPPGPKGYPIIGNSLDAPLHEPWKTFRDWSKIYGPWPLLSTYLEIINQSQAMWSIWRSQNKNLSFLVLLKPLLIFSRNARMCIPTGHTTSWMNCETFSIILITNVSILSPIGCWRPAGTLRSWDTPHNGAPTAENFTNSSISTQYQITDPFSCVNVEHFSKERWRTPRTWVTIFGCT